jgi:hypothetical protein
LAEPLHKKKQDELSVVEVILTLQQWWKFLLLKWTVIVLAGAIGGAVGLVYAILKTPLYDAGYTFVLEEEDSGGLGAASGLASMIGINIGGAGGANALFKGDNIFELYRSRRMISKTLLTPVVVKGKEMLVIDRYIDMKGYRDDWKDDTRLSKVSFNGPQANFSMLQDSLITLFVDEINEDALAVEKPDKKLGIIKIGFKAEDQFFAKDFVNILVADVNKFYIQTRTKRELANVEKLERQSDSVKSVLYGSISKTAFEQDANPDPNEALSRLAVPVQKRQVDIQANAAIYAEIRKNLEVARMTLAQETPLIQEVDVPVLPLKKIKPGKLVCLIGFGFLGAFLTIGWLVVRKMWDDETRVA